MHWFFDKLGMTGSKAQLYNGLMLIFTFFSCRLVWGTYNSLLVACDVWTGLRSEPLVLATLAPEDALEATFPSQYANTMKYVSKSTTVPLWLAAIYMGANLTLNSLNFYWFFKMIDAVRKRFDPKQKKKEKEVEADNTHVKDDAVATAVKIDGIELKTRPRRGTLLDGEEDETPPI